MSLLRTREYPTKQQFESTDDFAKRMRDAIQEESTDRIQDFDILQLSNVPWTDVREYGAKGDGSTDDTIAIQAAIDASIGGQVLVPEGHYKFTALTFQKEIRFSGTVHGSSGTNGTVLESTATSGSAIALSGTASADRKRIYFENFTLIGNANLDKGFDIQGTASINPSNIGFRCVEVRTITKATGIGFYFKDASHVYMDNAIARNGTITGYGLYLDSQYFNGGPISAINCDFGNVDESVAGLYYTATSNHYNGVVFVGCYFGAGTAGGGHCIWIAHQTPTQMTFIGCGAECKNTQANGSAILIDGNTNNLAFINQSASGFTVVDYGIHFNSGAHKALKIHGMDFTGITDDHVQVESAASFEDSVMLGMRRDNAVKGWTGDFTGIMRQGFAQNRTDFGGAIIEHSFAAFTDEDATPPVSAGNNFVTANTAATSITNFDLGIAGQEITIIFGDADTTIVHDVAKIKLSGAANWNPAAGDTLTLKAYNSIWHEISRSDNT